MSIKVIDPFKMYYCKRIEKQVAAEYMCDLVQRKFIVCHHYNSSKNLRFPCLRDYPKNRKCLVELAMGREIERDDKG